MKTMSVICGLIAFLVLIVGVSATVYPALIYLKKRRHGLAIAGLMFVFVGIGIDLDPPPKQNDSVALGFIAFYIVLFVIGWLICRAIDLYKRSPDKKADRHDQPSAVGLVSSLRQNWRETKAKIKADWQRINEEQRQKEIERAARLEAKRVDRLRAAEEKQLLAKKAAITTGDNPDPEVDARTRAARQRKMAEFTPEAGSPSAIKSSVLTKEEKPEEKQLPPPPPPPPPVEAPPPAERIFSLLSSNRITTHGKWARFEYVDADGVITDRHITNWRKEGRHIVGFCLTRKAIRTFRQDRIRSWTCG